MMADSVVRFRRGTRSVLGADTGVPAPTTERGRQSRQRLLEAAERVFGKKGYFPASITDIVREAGVAQGTFYLYFKSKQHVFTELIGSLARTARAALRGAVADARDRMEEEERGFAAFFSVVNAHPYLYRIVRQAEFVDPDAFRGYYAMFLPAYVKRLDEAMDLGSVRRMNSEALASCLIGVADFVGMRWPYWTGKPIPSAIFDAMMEFIRLGMDPRDGPLTRPVRRRVARRRPSRN